MVNYENLGIPYLALNRFAEAQDIMTQALRRKLDDDGLHTNLYAEGVAPNSSATVAFQISSFARFVEKYFYTALKESDRDKSSLMIMVSAVPPHVIAHLQSVVARCAASSLRTKISWCRTVREHL